MAALASGAEAAGKAFMAKVQESMNAMKSCIEEFMISFRDSMKPVMIALGELFGKVLGDQIKIFLDMLGSVAYDMAGVGKLQRAANGAAFGAQGRINYLAAGGIVNSPTTFRDRAGGLNVMGEAGPEAVMPLRRGRDGRLGVEASGAVTVTVNVQGSLLTQGNLIEILKKELDILNRRCYG